MKEYSSPFLNPYGSDRGQVDVNTYINSLRDREASQGFFDRKKNTQIQGMSVYKEIGCIGNDPIIYSSYLAV